MADDINRRGPQDVSRININEAYELRYWNEKLEVSREVLKTAVDQVASAVEEYLKKNQR